MQLWLISQKDTTGYDITISAVVAAESEEEAQKTCPSGYFIAIEDGKWARNYEPGAGKEDDRYDWPLWTSVEVELLGTAVEGTQAGVINAKYRPG